MNKCAAGYLYIVYKSSADEMVKATGDITVKYNCALKKLGDSTYARDRGLGFT